MAVKSYICTCSILSAPMQLKGNQHYRKRFSLERCRLMSVKIFELLMLQRCDSHIQYVTTNNKVELSCLIVICFEIIASQQLNNFANYNMNVCTCTFQKCICTLLKHFWNACSYLIKFLRKYLYFNLMISNVHTYVLGPVHACSKLHILIKSAVNQDSRVILFSGSKNYRVFNRMQISTLKHSESGRPEEHIPKNIFRKLILLITNLTQGQITMYAN